MYYTLKGPPAMAAVSGRNLAHAKRDATERAFLGSDIKFGIVAPTGLTDTQIAQLVKVSVPYLRAAEKVAAAPGLRAQVEQGQISLADAAKSLRPPPKQPKPAPTLLELFAGATPGEREECMRAYADEAFAVFDDMTAFNIAPAVSAGDMFAGYPF